MMVSAGRLATLSKLLVPGNRTREAIQTFQGEQLRRLVRHAYDKVPYYRKLFDRSGVRPDAIRGREDLHLIPVSSRVDFQRSPSAELLSAGLDPGKLFVRNTSGSTGRPVSVRCSLFEESLLTCLCARELCRAGLRYNDRLAEVKLVYEERHDPRWQEMMQKAGIYRSFGIDSLLPPREIRRRLQRVSPDIIIGYPGILSLVARQPGGGVIPSLRKVIVGGETLTAIMRSHIETGFGVPVQESYACHEFNQIAMQCPSTGYLHIVEEGVLLEILERDNPVEVGQQGEVVVTALHSFSMPFIRYRLGDLATRGPQICPCGAEVSTLKQVLGRTSDWLVLKEGRLVHPFEVVAALRSDFSWIGQYQIVQDAGALVLLYVVPFLKPTSEQLVKVRDRVRRALREEAEVEIRLVEEIAHDSAGKYKICVSRVDADHARSGESST